jgi:hypothetical protein
MQPEPTLAASYRGSRFEYQLASPIAARHPAICQAQNAANLKSEVLLVRSANIFF